MALQIDSQESAGAGHNAGNSPLQWTFANGAGTLLVVGAIATGVTPGTSTVTGITYAGVALTRAVVQAYNSNSSEVSLWYLINPATTGNIVSISATFTTTFTDILGAAISFTGANLAVPIRGSAKNFSSAATTTASVSIATIPNDWVVSAGATGTSFSSANNPTIMSALDNVSLNNGGDNLALGQQQTSGGTVTAGFTTSNDIFGIVAAEIQAAVSATPQSPYMRFNRARMIR